jgi:ABC-2 type transport system ATP-binding protein
MNDPIRFSEVRRSFAGRPVLCGLSFRVRPGEIYALLGRNGAGKTTALSILLGNLRATGGECWLLGERSNALSDSVRERVGFVGEGHPLLSWMSVRQVLEFEAGTRTRFDRGQAEAALARLSIRLDQKVGKLSRGLQAQVALVVGMAGDPEVLILDDPAMGLDVVMRREFLDAMIDLLGREGRSVLFSSHILGDVERIADRVGILRGGTLVVDASLEDLKRRVEKRFARGYDGGLRPGVVSARPLRGGHELTLVDLDERRLAELRQITSSLSEPIVPSLEDLFVVLSAGESAAPAREGLSA